MLIQFSVENFRSFEHEATLSLVAAPITELPQNVFQVKDNMSLLKSAVIYGANASGKSNLLKAMSFMKEFIWTSSKDYQATEKIEVEPFRLRKGNVNKPISFEIVFMHENVRYRYGFSLHQNKVAAEWFYYVPNVRELMLFVRENQTFELSNHFKSEKALVDGERIRPNALFLSVSAQFNGAIASKVMEWFSTFNIISSIRPEYAGYTVDCLSDEVKKEQICELLKSADVGIENLSVTETKIDLDALPPEVKTRFKDKENNLYQVDIKALHKVYNNKGKVVAITEFDFSDESEGTKRFFQLSGPILDTLSNGKILVVDELDARMHPDLLRAICNLFNSENNKKNAQLIFVSHNTDLLKAGLLRRDQIWFAEKDTCGATELYSLVEYKEDGKSIRKDASFEKDYLKGRYGAVPIIRELKVPYGK